MWQETYLTYTLFNHCTNVGSAFQVFYRFCRNNKSVPIIVISGFSLKPRPVENNALGQECRTTSPIRATGS